MAVNRRDIHVHIGEIVLEGDGSIDRGELGEAVQRELARLQRSEPIGLMRDRSRDAIAIHHTVSTPPAAVDGVSAGASIARAVHATLRSP